MQTSKYIGERMVREAHELYGVKILHNHKTKRASTVLDYISRVSQKFIENALFENLMLEGGGGVYYARFTHIDDLTEGK